MLDCVRRIASTFKYVTGILSSGGIKGAVEPRLGADEGICDVNVYPPLELHRRRLVQDLPVAEVGRARSRRKLKRRGFPAEREPLPYSTSLAALDEVGKDERISAVCENEVGIKSANGAGQREEFVGLASTINRNRLVSLLNPQGHDWIAIGGDLPVFRRKTSPARSRT